MPTTGLPVMPISLDTEQGMLTGAGSVLMSQRRLRFERLLWRVFLPIFLLALFWWFQARFGFNPTDDGFILGQSWRIAHGEVPHQDFTSPRPVGSALLHLPEVFLPWGMLAASRLVTTAQLAWIAIASVDLLGGRRLGEAARFLLAVIAFVLNVNTWPIMAWHSIDGVFLGVTALWLAERAARNSRDAVVPWLLPWLIAGLALLVKQGFVIVLFGVAIIAVSQRAWRSFFASPVAAIPVLLYAVWALGGGAGAQLYLGKSGELLRPIGTILKLLKDPGGWLILTSTAIALAVMTLGRRQITTYVGRGIVFIVCSSALFGPTLLLGSRQYFGISGTWSFAPALALALLTVIHVLPSDRETAARIIALGALGYGTAMSWGVPTPGLLAGSYAAGVLVILWRSILSCSSPKPARTMFAVIWLAVLALLTSVWVIHARTVEVYREGPIANLTATASGDQFALIQMSPQSAAYIESVQGCLAKYRTDRVAVLPDGPGLYPLLGVRNPFHLDWWNKLERVPGDESLVYQRVAQLNDEPGWLVLFQSFPAEKLSQLPISEVTRRGAPFAHVPGDLTLLDELAGQPVQCAAFTGVYSP